MNIDSLEAVEIGGITVVPYSRDDRLHPGVAADAAASRAADHQ
jgi:hypothetical protein